MKRAIGRLLRRLGYEVSRYEPSEIGQDPFADMRRLVAADRPVILDIGANVGQTIRRMRERFPESVIHAMEPSPESFGRLAANCGHLEGVRLWNVAMGSDSGRRILFENESPEMSSLLELGAFGWGTVTRRTDVPVTTVDAFCQEQGISGVDILKSDTQGFDLEVFRGASEMMRRGSVRLIYFELIWVPMYAGTPSAWEPLRFLDERQFRLVSMYRFSHQRGRASWVDALFAHESVLDSRPPAGDGRGDAS